MLVGAQYFTSTTQKMTCIWPPTHIRQYVVPGTNLPTEAKIWVKVFTQSIGLFKIWVTFSRLKKRQIYKAQRVSDGWSMMTMMNLPPQSENAPLQTPFCLTIAGDPLELCQVPLGVPGPHFGNQCHRVGRSPQNELFLQDYLFIICSLNQWFPKWGPGTPRGTGQ